MGTDRMPRKDKSIRDAKALGMSTADEILNDDEAPEDVLEFEFATREDLLKFAHSPAGADLGVGMDLIGYAAQGLSTGLSGAVAADQQGSVVIVQADDDFVLESDWFTTASEELLHRTSTGEKWSSVVQDLSRRFSEFFDGSYEAFSFALDAFVRRAHNMGLGDFCKLGESTVKYRGRTLRVDQPIYRSTPNVFAWSTRRGTMVIKEGEMRVIRKPWKKVKLSVSPSR